MIHHEIKNKIKRASKSKTSFQRSCSQRRQQSFQIEERASRLNHFQRRSAIAVNADFDALARSKNKYDSSDEENERVVELFDMWSKIDADDLLAWVGVWVVGMWVTSVSGRWVWAFCSKEEQKEEQIKKRERKKSKEERIKKKRKESDRWDVTMPGFWVP